MSEHPAAMAEPADASGYFLEALWAAVDRHRAIREAHDQIGSAETAEAVVMSRLAVHGCLVAAGWTPPAGSARTADADRRLLRECGGVIGR
jgi:hypothetical protein